MNRYFDYLKPKSNESFLRGEDSDTDAMKFDVGMSAPEPEFLDGVYDSFYFS